VKPACIYCPSGVGTTRDHVPPRGFFQDPVPTDAQLITVPCSEECRARDTANDELARNILVSLEDTEPADYVSKYVVPRRDRSLARSRSQALKMIELMRQVVRKDTRGNPIGEDLAFCLDHPCMDRFLERTGRAFLFRELGVEYFDCSFEWRLNPPIPDDVYRHAVTSYPKRNILNVVAYSVSPEFAGIHWIIAQFYGGVEFLLRFQKQNIAHP
jgi:hypothetical protein